MKKINKKSRREIIFEIERFCNAGQPDSRHTENLIKRLQQIPIKTQKIA